MSLNAIMNLANTFEYQYERLDNDKLIAIVNNSRNFQPLAVETAYLELQRRILSPDQLTLVNESFNLYLKRKVEQQNNELTNPQPKVVRKKPAKQNFLSAIRLINTVALTVLAVFLISLMQGDTVILHMIANPHSYRPSFIFIAVPYLMLPFGAIGFGLRRQLGWIMLAWAVMYNALQQGYFLKNDITIKLDRHLGDSISDDDIIKGAIVFAFYLTLTIVVCLPGIRAKMKAGMATMFITMITAVGFLVLQVMKVI